MEILKLFNIKQPILLLKTLSDGNLGMIDAQNSLRIASAETYALLGGFKTNIQHERIFGSHVDISMNGEYSFSVVPGTNQAALFNIPAKALVNKFGRHKGEVESVAIDPKNRYCVTCGQDGKAYVWVIKTGRLAFVMPPHADYVTMVAFNPKGQWIATGSYDRSIQVLNLGIMKQPIKLRGHNSPIVRIVFLSEGRLLSVEKEGSIVLWDMHNAQVIKRFQKMNDEVTAMCTSPDGRFVFVGTKLGYVGLYDTLRQDALTQRYVKESEAVTSLAFMTDPYRLAVGTAEGNVRVYSLFGDEEEYVQMLRERRFKAFYDALEINPMLGYSKAYETAERIWDDAVNKARTFLENSERDKAKELLDIFSSIPGKNAFINQLLRDYEKYTLFKKNVLEERYALAYSLATQYPAFQDSEPYRSMELRWQKAFTKAQELIMTPNGEEQARAVLSPYRGISAKTVLIQQLFEKRKMYDYFKQVIRQADYVRFHDLVKRHPFLKEFAEYTAVMEYADRLYIQANKAYDAGDYATAQKGCEVLVYFPDYAYEMQKMADTIRIKHLFWNAVHTQNMVNAFSYLSQFPFLYDTPEAQELEEMWNKAVDEAQHQAALGDPHATLAALEAYRTVRDKHAAIGIVMQQAYCVQLEHKIAAKAPQKAIENGIRQYVRFFGVEEGIEGVYEDFLRAYKSELVLNDLPQGSLETWSPLVRVDDITVNA